MHLLPLALPCLPLHTTKLFSCIFHHLSLFRLFLPAPHSFPLPFLLSNSSPYCTFPSSQLCHPFLSVLFPPSIRVSFYLGHAPFLHPCFTLISSLCLTVRLSILLPCTAMSQLFLPRHKRISFCTTSALYLFVQYFFPNSINSSLLPLSFFSPLPRTVSFHLVLLLSHKLLFLLPRFSVHPPSIQRASSPPRAALTRAVLNTLIYHPLRHTSLLLTLSRLRTLKLH